MQRNRKTGRLLHNIYKVMGTVSPWCCYRQANNRIVSNLPTKHIETCAVCKSFGQSKILVRLSTATPFKLHGNCKGFVQEHLHGVKKKFWELKRKSSWMKHMNPAQWTQPAIIHLTMPSRLISRVIQCRQDPYTLKPHVNVESSE